MNSPKPLSRRDVLNTAAALGVGAFALAQPSQANAAQNGLSMPHSGLVTGVQKPLKYDSIPGLLTKEQITPHHQAHYGGALKRYVKIESDLHALLKDGKPLPGDAYTLMQKDKLNRMNSVLLHELYFGNLTPKPDAPGDDVRDALAKRFGSLKRWMEDFRACCMASAGWGILVRDMVNGKLYNVSSDQHEVGVLWLGQPSLVCDVYEHAFYVDYQNRKKDYVDKFVQFLDWNEIQKRYRILAG